MWYSWEKLRHFICSHSSYSGTPQFEKSWNTEVPTEELGKTGSLILNNLLVLYIRLLFQSFHYLTLGWKYLHLWLSWGHCVESGLRQPTLKCNSENHVALWRNSKRVVFVTAWIKFLAYSKNKHWPKTSYHHKATHFSRTTSPLHWRGACISWDNNNNNNNLYFPYLSFTKVHWPAGSRELILVGQSIYVQRIILIVQKDYTKEEEEFTVHKGIYCKLSLSGKAGINLFSCYWGGFHARNDLVYINERIYFENTQKHSLNSFFE